MGKRLKEDTALMIREHPFMKIMWRETSSGLLCGLKIRDVDVHLQIVFDQERQLLSAHISDKRPGQNTYPWRMERTVDQMLHSTETFVKTTIRRYKPNSMYRQFHPLLLKAMGFGKDPGIIKEYDIAPMITAMVKGRAFRKCRVRDGLKYKIPRAGFILKDGEYYFVMPFDKDYAWVQNIDIKKSPLWDLPTTRGFFAYFAYLDKHKIIEKSEWFSKKNKRKLKGAVLTLLAEAEGRVNHIREG